MNKYDIEILARTLYGEARGEVAKYGISPLLAVANVVMNRYKRKFAASVADVCLAPYQFSCWNHNDQNYQIVVKVNNKSSIFRLCQQVAEKVIAEEWPDITNGCDHYHSNMIKPYWAACQSPRAIIGNHLFYNLRG